MQRAEVWWANLPQPAGHRPVVVVTREQAIGVREFVVVAQVTSRIRHLPVEVPLGPEEGLPKACAANCDVLITIPKTQLDKRITTLSLAKRQALDDALRYSLGLD